MGGTNTATMLERHNTYILPWEEPILPPCQKDTALTYDHWKNQYYHHVRREQHLHMTMGGPTYHNVRKEHNLHLTMGGPTYHHVRKAQHLYMTMGGMNPTTMSKRHTNASLPLGRNLDLENTNILPEVLKLHSSHF